jgi:hypothetical protein
MLDPGTSASSEELVTRSAQDADAFASTVSAFGEDSPQVRAWLKFGVPFSSGASVEQAGLADLQTYAGHVANPSNSVWMDNTTLVTASALLRSETARYMTPLTLWDVITYSRCVVHFNVIYHNAHPMVDDAAMNDALGEQVLVAVPAPFAELPPDAMLPEPWNGIHRFLCELRLEEAANLRSLRNAQGRRTIDAEQLEAVCKSWRTLLDMPLQADDILDVDNIGDRWTSPSNRLLTELADATKIDESYMYLSPDTAWDSDAFCRLRPQLRATLTDSNLRCALNQRQADFFGLPYAPSIVRMPFRGFIHRRRIDVQSALNSLTAADERYASLAKNVSVRVPVDFAVALKGARRPEDIWPALAERRDQARKYRSRRAALDAALEIHDAHEANKVAAALKTDAESLLRTAGHAGASMVGAVGNQATKGPPSIQSMAIAALVAGAHNLVSGSFKNQLLWRVRRPDLFYLNSLVDEAQHVVEALPLISTIWGLDVRAEKRFASQFRRAAALQDV